MASGSGSPRWDTRNSGFVPPSQLRATSPPLHDYNKNKVNNPNNVNKEEAMAPAGHARSSSFFSLFKSSDRPQSGVDQDGGGGRRASMDRAPPSSSSLAPVSSNPSQAPSSTQQQQPPSTQPSTPTQPAQAPQLHPEIRSVVQLTLAHAHKIYVSGPLVRRIERLPDGHAPGIDDGWRDVWAQLGGTTLSVWDMAEIEEANKEGREVPPTYINITDAFVQVLGAVTIPATRDRAAQRYTNVVTVNSAGNNLLLFACPDGPALIAWSSALRLAAWEKSRLEEIYTAHLLRITLGAGPRNAQSPLVRGKLEGFVRVRVAGQTDWKRLWMVVSASEGGPAPTTPPTERKRRISSLFGAPAHVPAPEDAILRATVQFYAGQKGKDRKKALLSVLSVTQAFAVYPERPELINRSTLLKLEGTLGEEEVAGVMRGREGWVLVMPELEAGFSQAREMLKWLIGIHDAFDLYGRPKEYVWDPRNPASLMFAYPVGPARDLLFLEREAAEAMDPREDRTSAVRAGLYDILASRMRAQGMLDAPAPAPNANATSAATPGNPSTLSYQPPNAVSSRKVSAPPTLPPLPLGDESPVSEAGDKFDHAGGSGGGGGFQLPPLKFGSDEGSESAPATSNLASASQPPPQPNPVQSQVSIPSGLSPIHEGGSGDTMGTVRTASGGGGGFVGGFVERFGNEPPRGSSLDKEKEGARVTSPLARSDSPPPVPALNTTTAALSKQDPAGSVLGERESRMVESPRNLVESPRSGFRLPSQERDFEPPVRRHQPPTSPVAGEARFSVVRTQTQSPPVGSGTQSPLSGGAASPLGSRSPPPAGARQGSFSQAQSPPPPSNPNGAQSSVKGQSPPASLPHSPQPPSSMPHSPQLPHSPQPASSLPSHSPQPPAQIPTSPPALPDSRDSFRTANGIPQPTSPPELGSRDSFRTSTSSFAMPSASVSRAASSNPSANGAGSGSGNLGLGGRYEVLPSANASSDVHPAGRAGGYEEQQNVAREREQGMGSPSLQSPSMMRAPGSPSTFGRNSPYAQQQQQQQQGRSSPFAQQQQQAQQGRQSPYQQQDRNSFFAQQQQQGRQSPYAQQQQPQQQQLYQQQNAQMYQQHNDDFYGHAGDHASIMTGETGAMTNPYSAGSPGAQSRRLSLAPSTASFPMQMQMQPPYSPGAIQQLPPRFQTPPVPASPRFSTPPVPSSPLARQGMGPGNDDVMGDALAYMRQMDSDPRPPRLRGAPPLSMEDETEEGQLEETEEDLDDEEAESSEYHGAAAYGVSPTQRRSLDRPSPRRSIESQQNLQQTAVEPLAVVSTARTNASANAANAGVDRRPTGARAAPPPASNRRSVALEPNQHQHQPAVQRIGSSSQYPARQNHLQEMDENADALAALSFLDQPDEQHAPARQTQQPAIVEPELESQTESEGNTRAPSPAGSQYRSSFAPSKAAAARKAKSEASHAASLKPGRAPGNGKARKARAWGDSSEEEEEEEEEEDDVDSDGEPAERARPPRNLPQVPMGQGGPRMQQQQQQGMYPPQQQQQMGMGLGAPPMHGPYDTEEPYAPSMRRPSDYGSTAPPRSMYDEAQYQQQQQQPQLATHAPVPSVPRNIWNQVLDPSAPQPQQGRDTFVQLEAPEATMTKAFTPHGLLSAGLQDKQDRSAKKQEELARETGASLINVPHKPPPPQTGLLGAITAHERERKREGGVGAALTEREREKRAAEERQRKIDELQRQQLEHMTQTGSMYGAPGGGMMGGGGMMNPMMLNPMMSMYGMQGMQPGLMPQMTGMGMGMMGMNPYAANQQHMFAAQQAQQAYQQAMMSFSQAGSQAGDAPQNPGGGPGGASPAPGGMHPMMTGGSFADPRMSMMMNPMMSPMMTGGMNPMMGMGGMGGMNPYMMGGGSPMMGPGGGGSPMGGGGGPQSGFFPPMDQMGGQQGMMMQAPPSMGELSGQQRSSSASRNGSPARGSPLARPQA